MSTPSDPAISASDRSLLDFLFALDSSAHVDVTDWEAQFLADLIDSPRPLTPAQRTTIAHLRTKYGHRL